MNWLTDSLTNWQGVLTSFEKFMFAIMIVIQSIPFTDDADPYDLINVMVPIWMYVFPLALMARTTSVWLTVAIAAQRCLALTRPLQVSADQSTPANSILDATFEKNDMTPN